MRINPWKTKAVLVLTQVSSYLMVSHWRTLTSADSSFLVFHRKRSQHRIDLPFRILQAKYMSLVAAWYIIVYKGEGLPSSSSIDSARLASGRQKRYNNDSNRHILHLRCRDCVLSTEMRPHWHTVGASPKDTWLVARASLLVVKPSWRPTEDVGNGAHGKHETFLLTSSLLLRTMEKGMNESLGWARAGPSKPVCVRLWCGQPDWWCRRNPPQVSASTSISRNKRMEGLLPSNAWISLLSIRPWNA